MGVGIVAGAPYYCAEDSFFNMLLKCAVVPFLVNVNDLAYKTRAFANSGSIDSVDGLRHDKVMLVSGKLDLHVRQGVMKKLYDYYKIFVDESNIAKQFDIVAPHAMLSMDNKVESCFHLLSPYVNNCNYPAAYAILQHIYGDIIQPTEATARPENLKKFDQSEFDGERTYLADTAYLYVPTACQNETERCRLHVALHGCGMTSELIGTEFVERAGYNDVAELNNVLILYPQIRPTDLGLSMFVPPWNLHGCYDFWGYTNENYAFKTGPQMFAIKSMIDRLTQPRDQDAGRETARSSEL
jgi:hypothetical protein